jgi:hypothetical protein
MLILPDLPPPPPALKEPCGPPAPALKHAKPRSAAFSVPIASKVAAREMPGAIVAVEDESVTFLTQMPAGLKLMNGGLRLFTGREQPTFPMTPPMPVWMDPSVTMSGGNVAQRLFTIGGGSY